MLVPALTFLVCASTQAMGVPRRRRRPGCPYRLVAEPLSLPDKIHVDTGAGENSRVMAALYVHKLLGRTRDQGLTTPSQLEQALGRVWTNTCPSPAPA
jgi:hypothetical protein